MDLLFVYGTLMKKCSANEWSDFLQKNANYLGEAKTKGDLYKIDYYPGLILSENWVYGELFELNDPSYAFHYLDQYEDFNPAKPEKSLYLREKMEVLINDAVELAWVYIFNRPYKHFEKYPQGRFIENP
ncbi:gamma-glutamylcyclotransferase family protein [Jiulongibacter sp. NS-SX5]|uniref:gamma-glutamylcyclotransferase family protein n=1 Tax=Jiulongibacter sp. NS-SX5 TaxID=3463854 RepID=UPI00405A31BD